MNLQELKPENAKTTNVGRQCARLAHCPFFSGRLANMPRTAAQLKQDYCYNDYKHCARYVIAEREIDVPESLYPSDLEQAQLLLQRHG